MLVASSDYFKRQDGLKFMWFVHEPGAATVICTSVSYRGLISSLRRWMLREGLKTCQFVWEGDPQVHTLVIGKSRKRQRRKGLIYGERTLDGQG